MEIRKKSSGVVLLATMLSLLLLAGLASILQARTSATLRALARLERAQEEAVKIASAHEALRPLIFALLRGESAKIDDANLVGRPFLLDQGLQVTLQDVDGQIDLYLASPRLLERLGIDPAKRQKMIEGLPPGERYPTISATLAQMGVPIVDHADLKAIVTQKATSGQLRLETLAPGLTGIAEDLTPLEVKFGGVERVGIWISSP